MIYAKDIDGKEFLTFESQSFNAFRWLTIKDGQLVIQNPPEPKAP